MNHLPATSDTVDSIALLAEPNRRRLYGFVSASPSPVSRDEAAAALSMSRELAAHHLDRLAEGGLLETAYRRLTGKRGPGAGRPAKLYRRAPREIAVSLPERHYDVAADLFAATLAEDGTGRDRLNRKARARGMAMGLQVRHQLGARVGRQRRLTALLRVLGGAGYEPQVEPETSDVCLRNCPYDALAVGHRELTCGMNRAWAEGLVEGIGAAGLTAVPIPPTGTCCVVFEQA